jgi:hypothetical protein
MTLVAGLLIAGLAGIAAAFYYSTRPGRSRVGAGARAGRGGAERFAGNRGRNTRPSSSRAVRSPSSGRSGGSTSSRTAGRSGPEPMTGSGRAGAMTGPGKDPAPLVAERRTHREASTGPRRRVAWHKGTDVDQELWPIETFGGVSDEQFWDDLAADRPLAATARTAQADAGLSTQPARAHPAPRPAAADRTAVQTAVQFARAAATPSPMTTRAYPARTQPSATATQPVRAARQPTEPRGRRSATADGPGTDEDPLTSPAYSLRAKGAVDGHSYQSSDQYRADPLRTDALHTDPQRSDGYRADPLRTDGYRPGSPDSVGTTGTLAYRPGSGSSGRHAVTAAYPFPWQPGTQPTRLMSKPLPGEVYGYRNPVGAAGDPRRVSANWGHSGRGGNAASDGDWGSHRAYPPVNGYRGPYDPWGNRRR